MVYLPLSVSGCDDEYHSSGVNAGGYECDIDICFAVHDLHHAAGARPQPEENLAACQLQYEELAAEVRCQQSCTMLLLLLLHNVK